MFKDSIWVAIGSAIGGVSRFWLAEAFAAWLGTDFPWGTVVVNITGCFLIGFFSALTGPDGRILVSTTTRQFVMIGICGGYTTFSSFSLQTLNMAQKGDWSQAGLHIGISMIFCLLAVWMGSVAAAAINQLKGT
ncbi:MAG: fluoride efflux transporter CrcB [Anaerolineaceae bacterium]|nr:fluoride efflux transporter CrcB [Anaerolineaceae bacterium]